MVKKLTGLILALILGMSSILSFTLSVSALETGKIWLNDDDTVTYATINDAVAAGNTGDTIRISGLFDTTNAAFRDAVVNNDMTLEVVSDTTILNDDDDQNGITIASGSHIKTVNGSTLNMQGFKKALDLQTGAEMNDGNYVFKDNQHVTLDGNVKGTSRESLVVDITAYKFNKLYTENLKLENATFKLTTSTIKTWDSPLGEGGELPPDREVSNGYSWNFKNVSFVGTALAATEIPNMFVDNSDISIDYQNAYVSNGQSSFNLRGRGVLPSEIRNSTFTLHNTLFGIIVLDSSLNIGNSKININLSSDEELARHHASAGILFEDGGSISIDNSELNFTRVNEFQTPIIIGSPNSTLQIGENTVINTPATNDRSEEIIYAIDNIASVEADPTSYVVTGGSFLVKYHKDTTAELSTTPINGAANGNEKLTYFQLADPSVTSLSPLNKNGQRYTYGVANPSSDGNKYVWVPSEKVTFSLGDNPSATFADGTNTNKETLAMRGHTIGMAVRANDEAIPSFNTTPISNDASKQFKGWFYRDATGNILPFDPNTTDVLETMDVFAMWEEAPQVTPTPIQPSQPTTSVTPKTSDNTNIGYQIGVLLVSLSAVVILLKTRNLVTK